MKSALASILVVFTASTGSATERGRRDRRAPRSGMKADAAQRGPGLPAVASDGRVPKELVRSVTPDGVTLHHYAIDPHVHTRFSGDARGSLRQVQAAAREAGLDAVVISDHGSARAAAAVRRVNRRGGGPLLILGAEAAVKQAHVGLWNIANLPARQRKDTRRGRLAMVQRLAEQSPDSLAVLNHPHWQKIGASYFAPRWLDPAGQGPRFDAVELWNGKRPLRKKNRAMIMRWEQLLSRGLRAPIVGASDAHRPSEVGRVHTVVLAPSLAPADLIDAVRRGRTYLSDGPRIRFGLAGVGPGDLRRMDAPGAGVVYITGHTDGRRRLRIFSGKKVIHESSVGPGAFVQDVGVEVTSDTWLRAELLHPPRRAGARHRLSLVTAPVYVDVAPYGDHWKAPPATWRDRPPSRGIALRRRRPRG